MLHPTPAPEGEPSWQRRRVTFNPEVSVNLVSSGSESASGVDPAAPVEPLSIRSHWDDVRM